MHAQTTAIGRAGGGGASNTGTGAGGGCVPASGGGGVRGADASGSAGMTGGVGAGRPSNQFRAGCTHSITAAATTSDDTIPPVANPVTSSGTARIASASRAPLEPCSTQNPRIAAAVAQAPATRLSSWIRSSA